MSRAELRFEVLGVPQALARPRAVRRGPHVGVYQERSTWQGLVALRAQQVFEETGLRFEGPVSLHLDFRMRRTSSLPKTREVPHTKKPDLDNACKAVLDGLVPALLADDRRVVELVASKRYALQGESPGCAIIIMRAEVLSELARKAAIGAVAMGREGR